VTLVPGTYTVTGSFDPGVGSNFGTPTVVTKTLLVTPEDADPKNTTENWINAEANGNAAITLGAVIYELQDGYPSDVSGARVSFVDVSNGNSPLGTCKDVRVNITDANNPTQGKATCIWTVTLGKSETSRTVRVGFLIGGTHRNAHLVADPSEELTVTITITRNQPYTMVGGGEVAGAAPVSMWPGTVGGAQFGVNISYTNKLTNPQGSAWVDFTVDGQVYRAKTSSLSNFSVSPATTCGGTSIFSSKAVVLRVLENGSVESVEGNAILQLAVTDGGCDSNGTGDQIAITVNGKNGGVIYSNNWDRANGNTAKEDLGSGNVQIRGR
jgi:hypothetical protein